MKNPTLTASNIKSKNTDTQKNVLKSIAHENMEGVHDGSDAVSWMLIFLSFS